MKPWIKYTLVTFVICEVLSFTARNLRPTLHPANTAAPIAHTNLER